MKIALALTSLNLRILLKDVVSLIWSIALPTAMLFLNKNNINLEYDLVLWFIFIYFNSFLYGVGIFALNQRETGFLSTIYSIKKVPYEFFFIYYTDSTGVFRYKLFYF